MLSADSPHQAKASPVIFGWEATRGVTARTSLPSRPTVGGEHRRHSDTVCFFGYHMVSTVLGRKAISCHVYVSVFCFYFLGQGSEVPHLPELWGRTSRRFLTRSQSSDIMQDMSARTQTSAPPSCSQVRALLWVNSRQACGGKPPCDRIFVKESLWCCTLSPIGQDLKVTTVDPRGVVCYKADWKPE